MALPITGEKVILFVVCIDLLMLLDSYESNSIIRDGHGLRNKTIFRSYSFDRRSKSTLMVVLNLSHYHKR